MKKGFTLIELLIVIAILVVLSTAVVIVLNPPELVKQGRDSTRVADLAAINSAIALYLADVNPTTVDLDASGPSSFACGSGSGSSAPSCTAAGTPPSGSCTTISSSTVDGTGWVAVNFGLISSGAPFSRLPKDPVNSTTFFYVYSCDNTNKTYELAAKLESTKYATTSATEIISNSKDGGDDPTWYEVGNDPALDLM